MFGGALALPAPPAPPTLWAFMQYERRSYHECIFQVWYNSRD